MDAYYQDSNALMSRGGKHRWAPAEAQKAALDRVYNELGGATPSKARIKELVAELSRHGPVTESNIYNWFQNKKARSKRKSAATEAESSIDDRNPKRMREDGAHSSGSLNMSSFDVDRMSEGGVSSGFEQRPGPPQQMQVGGDLRAVSGQTCPCLFYRSKIGGAHSLALPTLLTHSFYTSSGDIVSFSFRDWSIVSGCGQTAP
jgi:hypothetical protein